jgi:excinuclease ABC subunit C
LVEIAGIGPKSVQKLLFHFGSLDKIRTASLEELLAVVTKRQAQAIRKHFEKGV